MVLQLQCLEPSIIGELEPMTIACSSSCPNLPLASIMIFSLFVQVKAPITGSIGRCNKTKPQLSRRSCLIGV